MWAGRGATKWQGSVGLGAELPAVLEKGTGFIDHRYTCGQVAGPRSGRVEQDWERSFQQF